MNFRLFLIRAASAMLCCTVCIQAHASKTNTVWLAGAGKALQQVVVSEAASEDTKAVAKELADYLGRIAGTTFRVIVGDGGAGIAVGRSSDFPRLNLTEAWGSNDVTRREDYLLRSHAKGLQVIGATDHAVSHAVWDLLYRLGYRQYFPGNKWEIVSGKRDLSISVDAHESPSYQTRMIWYGDGSWDFASKALDDWSRKNRLGSGLKLRFGHAYHGIYERNKHVFDQHPEYLCNDKFGEEKFRISIPGLRQLVIADALQQIADRPEFDNISMEPSDMGGWCGSEGDAQLDSVSNRALFLANEVAAAINKKYPGKLVSMNAFNFHAPPPSIQAHPQVLVTVATALTRGGYTLDELVGGWSAVTKRLGIREYYSVNMWDHDMPAKARASNIDYLKRTIPEFYAKGARVVSAQAGDNWGPHGLGYYLAARMLWDISDAQNTDALLEDFLMNSFGPAKEPMREFYRQLDGSQPHPDIYVQLGRMFWALDRARLLANTPEINARIDDLVLYTRYVDLYQRYRGARGDIRQEAVEAVFRHAYRMRDTMMVYSRAISHVIAKNDKSVKIPSAVWNEPGKNDNWKSIQPFSHTELADFLREGLVRYPMSDSNF